MVQRASSGVMIRNTKWQIQRLLCIEGADIGFENEEEITEPIFAIETHLLVSPQSVSLVFGRMNSQERSPDVVSRPTASESSGELTQRADFWVLN